MAEKKTYVQELQDKLKARRAVVKQGAQMKALKDGAPELLRIIDDEISLELNRGYGDKPLSYDEYMESHGAVRGIRRIRNLMDAKEADAVGARQEVHAIQDNLKQIKNDQK